MMMFVTDSEDRDPLACSSDGILTLCIQQKVGSELELCCDDFFGQISGL